MLVGKLVEERVLVYFIVVVLMLHIPTYDELINTNGGHKISSRPEGLSFVKSMGAFNLLFHPCT